jgi:proton glutamate symport protein
VTFGTQLAMMLTLMLTSKGVAGVPRASLVILAGTLATFKLPAAGVTLILGVDTLMDMARTSVNLLGNCLATAVVARWEGVDLNIAGAEADAEALRTEGAPISSCR